MYTGRVQVVGCGRWGADNSDENGSWPVSASGWHFIVAP